MPDGLRTMQCDGTVANVQVVREGSHEIHEFSLCRRHADLLGALAATA